MFYIKFLIGKYRKYKVFSIIQSIFYKEIHGTPSIVARLRAQIAAHPAVEAEEIIFLGRQLRRLRRPGLVGIAAMDGHDLALRVERLVPAGHGIERHVIADLLRQLLQGGDMGAALAGAVEIIFIFDLHADDRPAILPQQPLQLAMQAAPEAIDLRQIGGIVAARARGRDDPVGDAAEARFGMGPGAGRRKKSSR